MTGVLLVDDEPLVLIGMQGMLNWAALGYEVVGKVIKDFPVTHILKDCKPVLKTLKGWHCDIRGIQNFEDLPQEAKDYVAFIEQEIGHKIIMVSNGPEREAILPRA